MATWPCLGPGGTCVHWLVAPISQSWLDVWGESQDKKATNNLLNGLTYILHSSPPHSPTATHIPGLSEWDDVQVWHACENPTMSSTFATLHVQCGEDLSVSMIGRWRDGEFNSHFADTDEGNQCLGGRESVVKESVKDREIYDVWKKSAFSFRWEIDDTGRYSWLLNSFSLFPAWSTAVNILNLLDRNEDVL